MNNMYNKTVIITGATGGIGYATAINLIKIGVNIIALDIDKKKLDTLVTKIKDQGGQCTGYKIDLSKYDNIIAVSKKIKKEFPNIDWLINMAGWIDESKNLDKQTPEAILQTFNINTLAPIYLSKLFLPIINKQGGIINISSTAALSPSGFHTIYSSSKSALNSFSQGLARQLSDTDNTLSVIAICPGPTNTIMREKIAKDASEKQSPEIISKQINKIISQKTKYKNGDILSIIDGQDKLISSL